MTTHFIERCSCGVIVAQCRCPDPNKTERRSYESCTHGPSGPLRPTISRPALASAIEAHLASRGTTLWSCAFWLVEKQSPQAAEWFIGQIEEVLARMGVEVSDG